MHDPWPWVRYLVARIAQAYELFGERAAGAQGGSKRERVVRHVLEQAPVTFLIADVRTALPGISDGTIRNALDDLRRAGWVSSDGTGRGATWTRT